MTSADRGASGMDELVLGLDIGTASIGWALVELHDGHPRKLRAAGVRVFQAGTEGDISAGRDTSRAAARREARLRRRQLARRRHRLNKLAGILQRAGLLPLGDLQPAEAAVSYFATLDRDLFSPDARRTNPHLLLYSLRARALDDKLTPYEIGRALYHLAQRRGFLSNRRARAGARGTDQEKEEGKVKGAIAELAQHIAESGARTLGEYLSRLDPEHERVRSRWLGRAMLADEFEKIWAAQRTHHPGLLTDDLKTKVHQAIFFQRPLKTQRALIGACELEKGRRRAPMALLAAQRFRLLQKINDLLVIPPDGRTRPLSPEERSQLLAQLDLHRTLTFGRMRKLLRLPASHKFNFETEGEKGLVGNRTAHDLRAVFGDDRWEAFSPEEKDRVVEEMRSIHNRDALARRAVKLWDLDADAARSLADTPLEDGYCSLSPQALAKILPLMEEGMPYATARKQLYGDEPPPSPAPALPRLDAVLDVRNPTVERALTELRRVVNAVVRQHGRPALIRIELARDLKKTRKDRTGIATRAAANRRARERAAQQIIEEAGVPSPRRSDTEKWLLADECDWRCPYTGKQISVESLFGDEPQFDVEHIVPFPRSLDNSFVNKTLCHVEENRARKRNHTPWEAYHGTDQWDDIIARVKQFKSGVGRAKLTLFQTEHTQALDDFTTQQLNDTRYASLLAVRYVGLLYGAGAMGVDPAGKRCVQASRGAVTSFLRDQWDLNTILGGGEKTRDDHRQHAIDAAVVALTEPATIKRLSDAAARAPAAHRRRFAPMEAPWPGFLDDVRSAIDPMVVSHRVSRKVAAALHEETVYSKPHPDENGRQWTHIRKRLDALTPKDVAGIVDAEVRQAVTAKLHALGQTDPRKAFKTEADHPALRAADGRDIPIHAARIRAVVSPVLIGGDGARARQVKLGSNHHVEILETTDKRGQPRWQGKVVSTLEAMRRLKAGESVVQRDHAPGKEFKFSLAGGEIVELDAEQTKQGNTAAAGLYVTRTISVTKEGYPGIEFVALTDARMKGTKGQKGTIKGEDAWGSASMTALQRRNCRKVLLTPLGEVRRASD